MSFELVSSDCDNVNVCQTSCSKIDASLMTTCIAKSSVQKPTLLLESMNKIARDEDHDFELISQDSGWQLANSGVFGVHNGNHSC